MVTLYLYNTSSPQRKIYKTLTNEKVVNVTFRDTENVVSPVVLLTYIQGIDRYNYAYIPELHRYYFIESINELIGGVCALSLRCDVLMTYKPYIMNEDFSIIRRGDKGLTMIPDTSYPLYPYRNLKVIKFPVEIGDELQEHSPCFCLTLIGGR